MPSLSQRAEVAEARLKELEQTIAELEKSPASSDAAAEAKAAPGAAGLDSKRVLAAVHKSGGKPFSSRDLATKLQVSHDETLGPVLLSLQSSEMLTLKLQKGQEWVLTAEGQTCVELGSPEARLFALLPANGTAVPMDSLSSDKTVLGVGRGQLKKKKAVKIENGSMSRIVDSFEDTARQLLQNLSSLSSKDAKALSKRKLVKKKAVNSYKITKGPKFALEAKKEDAVVSCGSWARCENGLKAFNTNALGTARRSGALHPLLKFRQEYRDILIGMGFEEMETNNFVESAFWNFDALFQPQQHPARDAHDTFYIKDRKTKQLPPAYVSRVKDVHEKGGFRSLGYRNTWSRDEADKLCLRTHTTAVSARYLYNMGQAKEFKPRRCFSIDRVFRNETLDATHLAEFHQVEGFVADYDLNLGHLLGMVAEFFKRIGLPGVKFKPAYNPYTEPSMEIFIEKPNGGLMEVGNSGLFRPEMLRPMGLPEGVKVIAWGFGLERSMMKALRESNIRDLMGPRCQVEKIRKNLVIDVQSSK